MLDKNDRRYIIRRIITYISIAFIMVLLNLFCPMFKASALTEGQYINYPVSHRSATISNGSTGVSFTPYNSAGNTYTPFVNKGEGTLIFSYYTEQQSNPTIQINNVQVNGTTTTNCDIGSTTLYYDNTKLTQIVTAICPVNFSNGNGLNYIWFSRASNVGTLQIYVGETATFVSKAETNVDVQVNQQQVVNAVNQSNQQLITKMQESNQAVIDSAHQDAQQINDSINDTTPPSSSEISGNSSDWNNYNADNGVINQLVLMPITLLNSFVNGINGSCSPYDVGELWGEHIIFPCINLSQTLGSVWTIIDVILSGMFIFIFGKRCVKIFNDFTNLRSGQIDTLYGGDE